MIRYLLSSLHNQIAHTLKQLALPGPLTSLSENDREMYLVTLGVPFLQAFQLQARRVVNASKWSISIVIAEKLPNIASLSLSNILYYTTLVLF